MKSKLLASAALSVLTLFAAPSQAAIVDALDHSYLTDTNSQLDWLDVTTSKGQSYNYVSGQFGAGEVYAGWRYATGREFNGLVSAWTGKSISPTNYGIVGQENHLYARIDGLIEMLSTASAPASRNDWLYTLKGLIADTPVVSGWHLAAFMRDKDVGLDLTYAHSWAQLDGLSSDHIGSFLVRDTLIATPIPAAVFMFAPALLGFLGFRRRRRA